MSSVGPRSEEQSPFTEAFVQTTPQRFSLDPAALAAVLQEAWEVYDDEASLCEYRAPFTAQIEHLSSVLRSVQTAQIKWQRLNPETRHHVTQFLGGETADEFVGSRLVDVIALLDEFKQHCTDPDRGQLVPKSAADGSEDKRELDPIALKQALDRAFYWYNEMDEIVRVLLELPSHRKGAESVCKQLLLGSRQWAKVPVFGRVL